MLLPVVSSSSRLSSPRPIFQPHEYAKDLGIWSLALVLPQVLATPVAGYLLDWFQESFQDLWPGHTLGYTVIFLLSVVYYAFGTYFVKFLEAVD